MKVIRIICVDCGLGRPALSGRECPRCASSAGAPVKIATGFDPKEDK